MSRIIRLAAVIFLPCVIIYGLNNVLGFQAWWLSLLVCFFFGYPIAYSGRGVLTREREITREYILDLHNNKIGEPFDPSRYAGYTRVHSGKDGNDYISDSGTAICTQFVRKKQSVTVREEGFSVHLVCALLCGLSFLMWAFLSQGQSIHTVLQQRQAVVLGNISALYSGLLVLISRLQGRLFELRRDGLQLIQRLFSGSGGLAQTLSRGFLELGRRAVSNAQAFWSDFRGLF